MVKQLSFDKERNLDALETIYDAVINRYQFEVERIKHLDDKASNIIGFVGILASLISGFGIFQLRLPTNFAEIVEFVIFAFSLGFLILSLIFGLRAYGTKKFTIIPNAYFLIGKYEDKEKERIIRDLCDNYAVSIEDNMNLNDKKVANIKIAMYSLFLAVVVFSIFSVLKILM